MHAATVCIILSAFCKLMFVNSVPDTETVISPCPSALLQGSQRPACARAHIPNSWRGDCDSFTRLFVESLDSDS
jgi:hypothetical protein